MNFKSVLEDHASYLHVVVDGTHPAEVRVVVESWLKAIRPGAVHGWEDEVPAGALKVLLPSPERLLSMSKKNGHCLLIRPSHRDLLSMDADLRAEEKADAVIEASDNGETFQKVLAVWLCGYMQKQGHSWEKVAHKHQRVLDKELRAVIKTLSQDEVVFAEYLELFGNFLDLQEDLLARPEWEVVEKDLETLARRLDKKKNWRLLRANSELETKKNSAIFFLGQLKGSSLFVENSNRDSSPLATVATYLILHSLRRRLRQWEDIKEDRRPGPLVEEAFQNIPIPTLLMGPEDEVLQHNTAFVKLNLTPSNVKKLSDMDQVTVKGQTWSVRRAELPSGQGHRLIFTFLPIRASFSGASLGGGGQELGIITSSIAHELNNPLAGLLTALDLMSFEDHWDEESQGLLQEMKQGATRCKQLVDTFLGFSRVRTDAAPSDKDLLKRSAEQALNLQRFRMVESGLRLQLSLQQRHPYAYPMHGPSITMAIYLVLGEFMTALHHLKLLERQAAHGLVIEGVVLEDADNFRIRFTEVLPRPLAFTSKLLQYLLQQERLVLEERGSEFIFTHQNVLI